MFPGFHPCFCLQGFLSSFIFLNDFVLLYVGAYRWLPLFCVFLSFSRDGLFRWFCLAYPLPFIHLPPWGLLWVPSLVWGFSLSGLSVPHPCVSPTHGPFGSRCYGLGCGPFRCPLLLTCASSTFSFSGLGPSFAY